MAETEARVRGRRPRVTEEMKDKAISLYLHSDLTVGEVAKECGFSVTTLYRIINERTVKDET